MKDMRGTELALGDMVYYVQQLDPEGIVRVAAVQSSTPEYVEINPYKVEFILHEKGYTEIPGSTEPIIVTRSSSIAKITPKAPKWLN